MEEERQEMYPASKVLAIDPGTTHSGVVLYDGTSAIWADAACENSVVCDYMQDMQDQFAFGGGVVAIEDMESFGLRVGKEVFKTVRWSGRFEEQAICRGFPVCFVKRSQVKMFLCHKTAGADDAAIRRVIMDRFLAPEGTKSAKGTKANPGPLFGVTGHAMSAMAVAVTFLETRRAPWMPKNGPDPACGCVGQ